MARPYGLALGAAYLDELRCRVIGCEPTSRSKAFDYHASACLPIRRRHNRLGYQGTSVTTALERAVAWYRQTGMA